MDRKPIIAVDIDGCYFDTTQMMLDKMNERFGADVLYEEITDFHYSNLDLKRKNYLFKLWHDMDYNMLSAEPGAEIAINRLREYYDCIAVSSPMTGLHVRTKYERLKNDWGYKNVVLISRKTLIDADVLIDDAPHNIVEWLATNRPVVVFRRPWNQDVIEEYKNNRLMKVVYHWDQVPDRIEEALGEAANVAPETIPQTETSSGVPEADLLLLQIRRILSSQDAQRTAEL